jgi:hypothetical protein
MKRAHLFAVLAGLVPAVSSAALPVSTVDDSFFGLGTGRDGSWPPSAGSPPSPMPVPSPGGSVSAPLPAPVAAGTVINNYTTLTAELSTGPSAGFQITVADATNFNINDLILIWQAATTNSYASSSSLAAFSMDSLVGRRELARIIGKSGSNLTVTSSDNSTAPLKNSTQGSAPNFVPEVTQVIKVREFTDVTVDGTTTNPNLIAQQWDVDPIDSTGKSGGIVAFLATGTVNVNSGGFVRATGLGFKGGAAGSSHSGATTSCGAPDIAQPIGGVRGEGIAVDSSGFNAGTGAVANGAGGGNCVQNGGGGGGNGGGGGAGGTSQTVTNAGVGGRPLAYVTGNIINLTLSTGMTMGGGGGAGNSESSAPGNSSGRNGGGVVFFRAGVLNVNSGGSVDANGGTTPSASSAGGQGGGGGGGSIYIRVAGALGGGSCGRITANGSNGINAPNGNVGAGGGGGGGHVFLQAGTACTPSHNNGNAGNSGASPATDGNPDPSPEPVPSGGYCSDENAGASCGASTVCKASTNNCVACVANNDCTNTSNPSCRQSDNTCQHCNDTTVTNSGNNPNAGCTGHTGTPLCKTSGGNSGSCVACLANTDCTSGGSPACRLTDDTCQPCNDTTVTNNGANPNAGCAGRTGFLFCNGGSCVNCLLSTQCPNSAPICTSNTCGANCTGDSDCTGRAGATHCDTVGPNPGQCVECAASSQCPNSKPICTGDACAASCTSDNDCTGRTGATHCDTSGGAKNGQCVECTASSQCPNSAPICTADACTATCTSNNDCTGRTNATQCATSGGNSGQCVQCTASSQCPNNAPICNASNACAATCTLDSNCTGRAGATHCDTAGPNPGQCVECTANSQCASTKPLCSSDACVGCNNATSPSPEQLCAGRFPSTLPHCATDSGDTANFGHCVACRSTTGSGDCTVATAAFCSTSDTCVGCNNATTNPTPEGLCAAGFPATPHCSTDSGDTGNFGHCVACRHTTGSGDCTDPNVAFCGTSDACVGCNNSGTPEALCAGKFPSTTPHCATDPSDTGNFPHCVACRHTLPPPSPSPGPNIDCNLATASDCAATDTCTGCVTDGQHAECANFGATSVCRASDHTCVGCLVDNDCPLPSAPHCAANVCGNCNSATATFGDESCTRFASGGAPACQPNDGVESFPGQCKQCSVNNTTQCTGNNPACNFAIGACQLCTVSAGDLGADSRGCATNNNGHRCQGSGTSVFCGCTTDADCGSNTSGRICDGVTHLCANGCSRAAGRNNCPSGQFCTTNDMTGTITGVCTMTCNFDVDCATGMPTMPFCLAPDGDAGVGRCAACRTNSDCSGSTPVCEPAKKVCVECTTSQASACTATGNGPVCLANEQCGCNVDADCGNATSGRICDLVMSHKCITGCRTDNGNGCPPGLICTGAGFNPGQCVPAVDMAMQMVDAGAVEVDLSVPADLNPGPKVQLTGGGFGCDVGQTSSAPSLGGLLLLAFALIGLGIRRVRRTNR